MCYMLLEETFFERDHKEVGFKTLENIASYSNENDARFVNRVISRMKDHYDSN